MQRVLRWDVPVDDQWHEIGAGYVLEVASRGYRDRPGDLAEVWTLEELEDATFKAVENLPKRSVIVVGTGHQVPDNTEHVGTAVVPTHYLSHETDHTGNRQIRTSAGLVWHVFAKIDPTDERQLVPLGHRVDGVVRSAKVETLEDEATSLAYWMAHELGEHVDDQDGETLTQTVRRLLAVKLAPATAPVVLIRDWDDMQVGDVVVQNPALIDEDVTHDMAGRNDRSDFLVRRPGQAEAHPDRQIAGFRAGQPVRIDSVNLDDYQGMDATVATLDHDHGWRLWIVTGPDRFDPAGVPLYVSPDDIEPRDS
jgi:hypothetical protein